MDGVIKDAISKGKTELAIQLLVEYSIGFDVDFQDNAIIIAGRYKKWKSDNTKGIIDNNELNRIQVAILEILNNKKYSSNSFENKNIISSKSIPNQAKKKRAVWLWVSIVVVLGVSYFLAFGLDGVKKGNNNESSFTSDSLTWDLDFDENFVLSYLLINGLIYPEGSAVYPTNQQLTYRGYSESKINRLINSLKNKDIIEVAEIEDTESGRSFPAYKLTVKGSRYIEKNDSYLIEMKNSYNYRIWLLGSREMNEEFLQSVRNIDFVDKQTRFISEKDTSLSTISIWAYRPIEKGLIFQLAKASNVKIHEFKEND